MVDITKLKDPEFVPNFRYSIETKSGFKRFKGLMRGESDNLYEYKGHLYTEDHKIRIGENWVLARDIGKKVNKTASVYEPIEVDDVHSYITHGEIEHHNCLILDKICPFN